MRAAVVIGALAVVTSLAVSPAQAITLEDIVDAIETARNEAINPDPKITQAPRA
jgi:hypothetical protein